MLSLFSSRRNWDSPNPSSAGECVLPVPPPPPFGSGGFREGTYTVVLLIFMYFVVNRVTFFQLSRTNFLLCWSKNLFCDFSLIYDSPVTTTPVSCDSSMTMVFLFTSFIRIHWYTVPPTFQFTVWEDGFDYIVFFFKWEY